MAEEEGQERTEEATPKRLEDARKKGQIPRSRELSTMMVTVSGAIMLLVLGGHLGNGLAALLERAFSPGRLVDVSPEQLPAIFFATLVDGLLLIGPLLIVAFVATLLSAVLVGGFSFNLKLKLDQLDPIQGVMRLFSLRSLVELGKSILKVLFIGSAAWMLFKGYADDFMRLGREDVMTGIRASAEMTVMFFLVVSLPLVVIALIDAPWQLWQHRKSLRMTRQEVMDEHKESEGRPEVKAKLREMQQAAARRRMMEKVPKADVIITNPTHYAVALRYDQGKAGAPVLVAKGADEVAARIRELGRANDVMLVESPRLARAIFASTDLDQEIPTGLYLAVAQILTYVYQLRQWQAQGGEYPQAPEPVVDDQYLKGLPS